MVDADRIETLNDKPIRKDGTFVLYWVQQSQRGRANAALDHAIHLANELDKPVLACFGLMDDYPEACERHYAFQLEGLVDLEADLKERGIKLVIDHAEPKETAIKYATDAAAVVADKGYLRHLRRWRDEVADRVKCRVDVVDADCVVPVTLASEKQEVAARTLRPKIHRQWDRFLVETKEVDPKKSSLPLHVSTNVELNDVDAVLSKLKFDRAVKRSPLYRGGRNEALRRMKSFVDTQLAGYAEGRNEPADAIHSHMSMYLQYGQVSPVELALMVKSAQGRSARDCDVVLEELIVRRELSHNFCWYCPNYDSFESMPAWARSSMEKHRKDKREHVYSRDELAACKTHDEYWNAAMKQAVLSGFMHNYMRMYWGKKILEWSKNPKDAYETTLWLNNRFFIDGLNANSYGNVGWIFGLHDRPWTERSIFGVVRYMNDKGLERKFDIQRYVGLIEDMERDLTGKRGAKAGQLF